MQGWFDECSGVCRHWKRNVEVNAYLEALKSQVRHGCCRQVRVAPFVRVEIQSTCGISVAGFKVTRVL
jgi:hypothetical protein